MNNPLTYLEVNLDALAHNAQLFRKKAGPNTTFIAGVKADAFGHGLIPVSKTFLKNGADWLFVNTIEEAEEIENAHINAPILIAGYLQTSDLKRFTRLKNARLIVYNEETVQELNSLNKKVRVHIMIDTGMHREGISISKANDLLEICNKLPNITIEAICTHFAGADEAGLIAHFNSQLRKFNKFCETYEAENTPIPLKHCASSAAFLLHSPETTFNMIRPAASLYGIYPNPESKAQFTLHEAMSLKTKIAQVKMIDKYSFVGYGCTYQAKRPTRVALLPIGYNESMDRRLGNTGSVLINGGKCPIIGKISMHMTTVDVTKVPEASLEDEVVIFGKQGNTTLSIEEIAQTIGTNPHEIMTSIPQCIPRKYV